MYFAAGECIRHSLDRWLACALQKPDKKLGYVRIPVEEVARNKSMKDEWPLLEADKGDIQLRCRAPAVNHLRPIPAP